MGVWYLSQWEVGYRDEGLVLVTVGKVGYRDGGLVLVSVGSSVYRWGFGTCHSGK